MHAGLGFKFTRCKSAFSELHIFLSEIKLEILVILTYLKERLKYYLRKCLFISVGVIEN
jgi:hypothetical protein